MRILSVDDNPENLYLLEAMLRGGGHEVVSAQNGIEALRQLEQKPFDLIISDILMPQMDGFELCYQVKRSESWRHIPFIFYTATYTEKKDEELALSLGAQRFLIKPVEPENFQALIQEVVRDHEAGRPAPPPPAQKEEVLLTAYNRRLVRKIEQKVQQLEALGQKLEAALQEKEREVAERRRAEAEVRRLNADLEQRVRERTAELTAANKELETFASAVSHDLSSPLRGIAAFTFMLQQACGDKLDERGKQSLEGLQAQSERMGRLIEALLRLSRATRGQLRRERVNLSQLAREIEADLRREQPGRQVEFTIAPDLVVQGDSVLLRAVLQNLLGNAWKFTARSPQPRIEVGMVEHDGQKAYFVRDNGVGFDMAAAAKLFTPFQRLHEEADFPGTGIGLATVQQIIRRHGGKVWAEAAVGKGATFYFTLR